MFPQAASTLAYSNPYSAAAMAAGQIASSIFGGPDPTQTSMNAPFNPFTVDNSGWSVNFAGNGGAKATANPVSTLAQGLANGMSGTSGGISPLMLVILAAVVIVVVKHK